MKYDHNYYTYILECADKTYYTGITNNYKRRLWEHQNAIHAHSYTAKRLPVRIVYVAHFQYVLDAIAWEKRLKKWVRRKKEAVIQQKFDTLPKLSKRRQPFTMVTKIRWNFRRRLLRKVKNALSG